jgi:hypothetical protein
MIAVGIADFFIGRRDLLKHFMGPSFEGAGILLEIGQDARL